MAFKDYPHEMKRDEAMKDDEFERLFLQARERLEAMSFAFIGITNDLELYAFEVSRTK
jgi:hypothetical protein